MFKALSLTNDARLAVFWAPQWLSAEEEQAQAQMYRIGRELSSEIIHLVAAGTVDKHVYDIQQLRHKFDVRVLGIRVDRQESMSREEQLAALG